ncbi:hypothetical protein EDC39_11080 [Geothermobacter ehrlichii]|uniref:Uncharacterized protein n=1 Tax=Geothermobacter ehrlichii TaxID=213224 RepID=A0A5D3WI62_9BACT|nr:hypothetical protein [Geothermobacter ehrlichii]TYO97540.1 hypothetical protein EDC39_11080 [Geothermobacter ehrlichii]
MRHRPIITLILLCLPAFIATGEPASAAGNGRHDRSMTAIEQADMPAGLSDAELKEIRGRFLPAFDTTTGPMTTTAEVILWDEGNRAETGITSLQGTGNMAATILTRQSR